MILILIAGLATALNFIVILHKLRNKNIIDALIDIGAMILIGIVFVGTLTGMSIGMTASALISIYLWLFPFGKGRRSIIDKIKDKIKSKL